MQAQVAAFLDRHEHTMVAWKTAEAERRDIDLFATSTSYERYSAPVSFGFHLATRTTHGPEPLATRPHETCVRAS